MSGLEGLLLKSIYASIPRFAGHERKKNMISSYHRSP